MADSYRGTTADQDIRFGNKDAKLKKSMSFPAEFNQKVDKRKVQLGVFRPWIAQRVTQLLGFEDEVVIEYAAGLLEDESTSQLDPKMMQINLTGFLESKAPEFMLSLWTLLLSAQKSPVGVPQEFIDEKKVEMQRKQEEQSQAVQRRNDEMADIHQGRARMDAVRQRERGDRPPRGRGQPGGGAGRGGFRPPPERDSGYGRRRGPSPDRAPRRRRSVSPYERSRRRSPSPSRSPSPPPPRRRYDSRSPSPRPNRRRFDSPPPAKRSRYSPRSPTRSPSPRRRRYSDSRSPSPPPTSRRHRNRSPSFSRSRSRSRTRSRSRSPARTRRQRRSVTPKYDADGPSANREESHGRGSADLVRERMLRERAQLSRRQREEDQD